MWTFLNLLQLQGKSVKSRRNALNKKKQEIMYEPLKFSVEDIHENCYLLFETT